MKTVRYRFLFLLSFGFFIVLLTVGLFTDTYTKTFMQREFIKQTKLEAQSLELYMSMQLDAPIDDEFLKSVTQSRAVELAIYNRSGELLHSNSRSGELELWSNVVKDKIDKGKEYFISTENHRLYYVYELKQLDGYLMYGTNNIQYVKVEIQIWGMLVIVFIICVVICGTLINRILQRYFNPIDAVTYSLQAAVEGNHSKKILVHEQNETRLMTLATDEILDYLEDISKEHSTNEAWMKTLIENMSAGLILIDEKGYVQVLNRYLEQLIHVNRKSCIGRIYHEAIENKEITAMIEEIFMKEEKLEQQLLIQNGLKERYLLIHGAPIMSSRAKWRGVVVVFHDITTMKRLEKTRKDFVANVSHELRTPVTSIKGFTETLLEGAYKDESITYEFLTIMQKESARMESLVRDLLELSQIEKQDFSLDLTNVNLTEIVQNVLTMLKPSLDEKQIAVVFESIGDACVLGDEQRITQVVINILSNAKNYTPPNGEVYIKVMENIPKQAVEIEVRDTGIGIPEKDLPRIFERFYRADRARSRDSGGTGLGLSIVKHLMQAHQGKVKVESRVGEGSTFTLHFPKSNQEGVEKSNG